MPAAGLDVITFGRFATVARIDLLFEGSYYERFRNVSQVDMVEAEQDSISHTLRYSR